jgi:hypothetical protein
MDSSKKESFAFMVMTYNHEPYILEHLESIKYLIQKYGKNIDVDLIVNDDCSKDQTCKIVNKWLELNVGIFRSVNKLYNNVNIGTCASINNMLAYLSADRCKLTAGDDVYSYENIFKHLNNNKETSIISGLPLILINNKILSSWYTNLLVIASQVIYSNDTLLHRIKHFSYSNAPNIFYATDCLLNSKVRSHLIKYDVIEDGPLQIAIARQYPERKFQLINYVLVYYRRTSGSTFLVASDRFINDKVLMYSDLIINENNLIERLRIKSRKICFLFQNKFLNKIFNLDFYFFIISFTYRIIDIIRGMLSLNLQVNKHKAHYYYINKLSNKLREEFK